jgi:hypothetical protein
LIESGEKGSVLLRKGDEVKYISAVGYDVNVLNEIFERSVEREQQVVGVGETKIVKNIGLVGIKDEFIDLARQNGYRQTHLYNNRFVLCGWSLCAVFY